MREVWKAIGRGILAVVKTLIKALEWVASHFEEVESVAKPAIEMAAFAE